MNPSMPGLEREILLSFWKVHILHHASEGPVHGQWIRQELRSHGYELSPGTLYPLLNRLERHGWLTVTRTGGGRRDRKDYRLTPVGRRVLRVLRQQITELYGEVVLETETHQHPTQPHQTKKT